MRSVFTSLLVAGLVTSSITGCSKEEQKGETTKAAEAVKSVDAALFGHQILSNELLMKIPSSSAGFIVMDVGGPGYKALATSPWGQHYNSLDTLKKAVAELESKGEENAQAVAVLKTVLESLKELGLTSADGKSQFDQVAKSVVAYFDLSAPKPEALDIGVFISAAGSTKLSEKLPILEAMLKENGVATRQEKVGAVEAVVATLVPASEGVPELTIYLAATEQYLGLARLKSSIERLFNPEVKDGLSVLSQSPEFMRAAESIPADGSPLSLTFVSAQKLIPILAEIQSQHQDPSVPPFDMKTLPVDSFVMAQSISDKLVTKAAVAMTARTDLQKKVFAALDGATTPNIGSVVPKDVAFAIALDTRSLPKLAPLVQEVQGGEPLPADMDTVKNVQGATIALRKNDAGSPFPDLFISVVAENRETLTQMIEGAVGMGLAATGAGPEALWQSKDIAGTSTRFMTTPLGVGLFVASPKNSKSVLLATSERALKDLVSAAAAPAATSPDLLKTFISFSALADLLDGVKDSLAMFGGAATADLEKNVDTKAMRTWGSNVGSVGFNNGTLKIESAFLKPGV